MRRRYANHRRVSPLRDPLRHVLSEPDIVVQAMRAQRSAFAPAAALGCAGRGRAATGNAGRVAVGHHIQRGLLGGDLGAVGAGMTMDKYDRALAYLTDHPKEIRAAWCEARHRKRQHVAHCLFDYVTPTGRSTWPLGNGAYGCLTQIAGGNVFVAYTDALTQAIKSDDRIPKNMYDIGIADLPIFAEWQRRIDKELRRK